MISELCWLADLRAQGSAIQKIYNLPKRLLMGETLVKPANRLKG
jgi:hypothetical protein